MEVSMLGVPVWAWLIGAVISVLGAVSILKLGEVANYGIDYDIEIDDFIAHHVTGPHRSAETDSQ
jgi:hypothetical protein